MYINVVWKMLDQHVKVLLLSNAGDNVITRLKTKRQICFLFSTRIRTLSLGLENNEALKCCYSIFPTILTYVVMLQNSWNNISMYDCSPIQGNFMKPGSQSATYISRSLNIWRLPSYQHIGKKSLWRKKLHHHFTLITYQLRCHNLRIA